MQSQPTTLLCHYGYDPLDRLTSHTLPQTPERQRFYCKSRLTTEIQGAIKYSIVQQGDLLLAQRHIEGKALDTTLLATDQQRSVLQTLNADHSPQPLTYSPFGHRRPENGLLSLLGFNGERPDPVTGHYLLGNGYRAFNPVLMRFNSPDSLSPFGKGGLNSYAYCSGDPINASDPTGHFSPVKIIATTSSTITAQYGSLPSRAIKLRPGISPTQGVNALNQIDTLLYESSPELAQNIAYLKELNIARNSTLNLQKNTIKFLQSKSYPIDELELPLALKKAAKEIDPLSDRHTLLEFIKTKKQGPYTPSNSPFSMKKLRNARKGIFNSSTPPSQQPSTAIANAYWDEILAVEHPLEKDNMELARAIRNAHFL